MHKLAILALQGTVLLDLTIPYETFRRATTLTGASCYDVILCGPKKNIQSSGVALTVEQPLVKLRKAQTIVIPGMMDLEFQLPNEVKKELLRAHARGARLVSICSGAFLLAQTGLLDGKSATTHWMGTRQLQERYPKINVDPNVLYVENDGLFTSAGAFAGMDLCLHILRKDFGASIASQAAKVAVTPLERSGGQAQFISHELPQSQSSLDLVLTWAKSNLHKDISVEALAKKACMSVRTLNRQFQKQLGLSPHQWTTLAGSNEPESF